MRHPAPTSDNNLLVRCCTNVYMYAYSLRKLEKHCLKIGKKERFAGVGREQAILLRHVYKADVNDEEEFKN